MMPQTTPNLKDSVETLKNLSKHNLENSPKAAADVFVAAVGLMACLKVDQAVLISVKNEPSCPSPDKIPAITAVLNDAKLFGALLGWLGPGISHEPAGQADNSQAGRKRSLSISGESAGQNKSFKLAHHSPVPNRKTQPLDLKKPSMKLPVLAATILSVAFAHVDHWPVQFVEAYAVDAFGSRTWVDEEACALFVRNLAIMHKAGNSVLVTTNNSNFLTSASRVASAYRQFKTSDDIQTASGISEKVVPRRPSFSSSSSLQRGMERAVSSDTVDSVTRAQVPYDSGMDWEIEEEEQQERVVSATPNNMPSKKRKHKTKDDSSSSGGEDEQVVALSDSGNGDSEAGGSKRQKKKPTQIVSSSNGSTTLGKSAFATGHYPLQQTTLNLQLVRQRYFGDNLLLANEAIHRALLDRLEQKSRQNSGLLQALPHFTPVPAVRSVVAENLARWLQSPALAGLARKLFAEMVDKMMKKDPPLEEDLRVIDFILAMKLKANQFSAHMENLTAVARRIGTPTVAQHIFITLVRSFLASDSDSVQGGGSDLLKMIAGVHKALPPAVSYDALAASLLTSLVGAGTEADKGETVFSNLRLIITTLASSVGVYFDTFRLLEALLSLDVNNDSWSVRNEEDKARLMFQCVTLHVASATAGNSKLTKGMDDSEKRKAIRESLHKARKSLLNWCCSDYGPMWKATKKKKRREKDDDTKVGAGTPDYQSALGPMSEEESIPAWLNTMRCLLFIEEANSDLMIRFLSPNQATEQGAVASATEEQDRIKACCAYGADIDDDMIRIVLQAHSPGKGKLPAEMAIQMLEHLFESCGRTKGTSLRVSDPDLVWELYALAQYSPPASLLSDKKLEELVLGDIKANDGDDDSTLPRLAHPGFWWRVTMLGLVMCGSSPDKIGEAVWKEHPTLRGLMKMVTAARYRFPTVDCDDSAKEEMKRSEQQSRETETRIAEFLFLPPKRKKEQKNGRKPGYRVSRRLQKQQEEKEAAAAQAESHKRKKMLKSAQKSIMLWDPDGSARKPPRESADLLLSVDKMFQLSASFQRCTTPDFLLLTIGETTRGAIERAYDWLIPIISQLSELISRLPSSASCFLLLRAYGTGSGDKSQLKKLSAPLLDHVKESLRGKYGEDDCIRAFELLMSDVASHNADRRKSSRRVLQDALGEITSENSETGPSSWMQNVLLVDHAKSLAPNAIKYMSTAATFERGKVLKSIVLALRQHLHFAEEQRLEIETRFPVLLAQLMSQRPSVFAEAIDTFSDLRELAVSVVYAEITKLASDSDGHGDPDGPHAKMWLNITGSEVETQLSLDLLQSTCVLVSISVLESKESAKGVKTSAVVQDLVDALLDTRKTEAGVALGLAGATCESNDLAVPVESWIMLCKARNDAIGKKAALAAPEEFLARLLLSSGLPRASLLAMVDRLGKLGDGKKDKDAVFRNLMIPSASSEWDVGRIGKQRDFVRQLIGRLSAYFREATIEETVSTSFLEWLLGESKREDKPAKRKKKPAKSPLKVSSTMLKKAKGMLSPDTKPLWSNAESDSLAGESLEDFQFLANESQGQDESEKEAQSGTDLSSSIKRHISEHDLVGLDRLFIGCLSEHQEVPGNVAVTLVQCVVDVPQKQRWMIDILLKWVPTLSKHGCTDKLRDFLFSAKEEPGIPKDVVAGLLRKCALSWTPVTVDCCLRWILNIEEQDLSAYSSQRLSSFLLTSLQSANGQETKLGSLSEKQSKTVCSVALRGLKENVGDQTMANQKKRSDLSDPLKLLLHLAEPGKKHFMLASGMLLSQIGKLNEPETQSLFGSAFLRLYLLHPQWANTGAVQVRTVLLKSAEENEGNWSSWVSTNDDQLNDLLESFSGGDTRVIKSLNEQSRKYPLLVLRKSRSFVKALHADAKPSPSKPGPKVRGENIGGPTEAVMEGRKVQLSVRHWGYEYSEPVWVGVLEIFCSIPKEVLYWSGQKLGLWIVMERVLQLLHVQLHLTSATQTSKIKAKVADMMNTYRQVNLPGYNKWLSSLVDQSNEVRNVLVSLSLISPEEAIESLKATK